MKINLDNRTLAYLVMTLSMYEKSEENSKKGISELEVGSKLIEDYCNKVIDSFNRFENGVPKDKKEFLLEKVEGITKKISKVKE